MRKNRGICSFISWVLIIVVMSTSIPVYAKKNNFEEIVLKLNDGKETQDDKYIATYLNEDDGEYYITINDLCKLTGCTLDFTDDTNIITVTQGFWSAKFDVKNQKFDDNYQSVKTTILEVETNTYAVQAFKFLYYFKANYAFIKDKTFYCRMPVFTEWKAMDVNYDNSLVSVYQLYGNKKNVFRCLVSDLIMDFVMGELKDSD